MKRQERTGILKRDLHIRLSAKERKALEKRAGESGMALSDYVRQLLRITQKEMNKNVVRVSKIVLLCQDILNHVDEKYKADEDEVLAEMEDKLWRLFK